MTTKYTHGTPDHRPRVNDGFDHRAPTSVLLTVCHWGWFFSDYFGFPLQLSFFQFLTHISHKKPIHNNKETCPKLPPVSQMKHQLDATLCRFYLCRVTLHVSGASAHHQEYLKPVQRPLVRVLPLQVSHHISLLGPFLSQRRQCFGPTFWYVGVPSSKIIDPRIVQVKWKHQLDATLCRFYFCRVTLHVSGAIAHHQEF